MLLCVYLMALLCSDGSATGWGGQLLLNHFLLEQIMLRVAGMAWRGRKGVVAPMGVRVGVIGCVGPNQQTPKSRF